MARLPYDPVAKVQPSDISGGRRATGEDFGGGVDLSGIARTAQQAGNAYIAVKEEDEQRKVLVQQAEMRAKYSKRLDEAAVNGEDTDKIKQELETDLAKISEGLETRKGADTSQLHAANTTAIFDNQANNINVHRATVNAKVEGAKFINGLAVQVSNDPSSLKANEEAVDAFVSTLTRVPADQRKVFAQQWKQALNVAAVRAVIRADPKKGRDAVESGQFDLSPEQVETSITYAHTVENSNRAAAAYEQAQRDRERREADDKVEGEITRGILTGSLSGKALRDALLNPALMPQTVRTLTAFAHARAQELNAGSKRSDQDIKFKLWQGIRNGEITDKTLILASANEHAQGRPGINTTDADYLLNLVGQMKDENNRAIGPRIVSVVNGFRRQISDNPKIRAASIVDSGVINAMAMEYEAQISGRISQIRAGGGNPNDVFDPKSKEYVGSKEFQQGIVDAYMGSRPTPSASLPAPKTQEEYNALPKGTTYMDTDGKMKVKK